MFICTNIDGTLYLTQDFNLQCEDSAWWQMFPVALIMVSQCCFPSFDLANFKPLVPLLNEQIFVYPIGVPAFFLYLLYQNKERLLEPGVRVQLGFL